jgi:hypothetical protein
MQFAPRRSKQTQAGVNIMIFEIFSREKTAKELAISTQNTAIYAPR